MKLLLENWREYINEEEGGILSMSLHDFDQTEKGWRSISDPSQQSEIMRQYIEANPDTKEDQTLMWHLGQALAFSGEVAAALEQMKIVNQNETHQYNKIYQMFTIYFLEEDMAKFSDLYNQFQSVIEGNSKDTNIQIVKCLKSCGDKGNFDYKHAYNTRCGC
jgi:hypothetical protein